MELNGDIIFDFLSQRIRLKRYNRKKQLLVLKRPVLYEGGDRFEANRLYIALADHLPEYPLFEEGVVVICTGGKPPASFTMGMCDCMSCIGDVSIFQVFNQIQAIYDRFDLWDKEVKEIIDTTDDIQKILDVSFSIVENPMVVLGQDYRFLGYSEIIDRRDDLRIFRPDSEGKLDSQKVAMDIESGKSNMKMRSPFKIVYGSNTYFVMNLYNGEIYKGNLLIAFIFRSYRESDNILAQYFAKRLEEALSKKKLRKDYGYADMRKAFIDLVSGLPLRTPEQEAISRGSGVVAYQLMLVWCSDTSANKIPISYICRLIEESFKGSTAFEHESAIVTVINRTVLSMTEREFYVKIDNLLESMKLYAGISMVFSDLNQLRYFLRQASVAYHVGMMAHPENRRFLFADYLNDYMLYNCSGEFPLEMMYTEGFKKLIEYNRMSKVDYIGTLERFIDNDLNIAKTANELFVHRSTFLERINRIETILNVDLHNPDQRLYLNIILKARKLQRDFATALHSGPEDGIVRKNGKDSKEKNEPLISPGQYPELEELEILL